MTANSILIRHADRKQHQRTSFEIFEQHPTYRRYRSRGVEVAGTQDKIAMVIASLRELIRHAHIDELKSLVGSV